MSSFTMRLIVLVALQAITLGACATRAPARHASTATPSNAPPDQVVPSADLVHAASAEHVTSPMTPAERASAPPNGVDVATSAPTDASVFPSEQTNAVSLPAFEIEPVHAPGHRPGRPTGALLASAADEELARWNVGGSSAPEHPGNRSGFHPGVRVIVDTKPLRRIPKSSPSATILTEARLLARARSAGYWPFRTCFEGTLRRNPKHKGGTSRVRVSIAPSGNVTAARVLDSELDGAARRCLLRAAHALRFEPTPARRLDVDLFVKVAPGDAPLPPLATAAAKAPAVDVNAAHRLIHDRAGELARCYVAGLDRDPSLWGRVALRARVQGGPTGTTVQLYEDDSRFPDPRVTECLIRELAILKALPSPAQPAEFVVGFRLGKPPSSPQLQASEAPRASEP